MSTRPGPGDWHADRLVWGLTEEQYCQYLMRLHDYHSGLAAFHGDKAERYGRIASWMWVAALVLIILAVLL